MKNLDMKRRHVMSIINITPDSFYEGSRTPEREQIAERVRRAVAEGATILDVGGYSSRPGAAVVSVEDEWARVDLGVGVVREVAPHIAISVDTFRAEIVRRVVAKYGDIVVNDIMAGEGDVEMFEVVAQLGLPYIAMHMRGTPETMAAMTDYKKDIAREVYEYFEERVALMREVGIEQIILDPGFGFAKSLEQNYQLLSAMKGLQRLGYPILVGLSRKSMIYKPLEIDPSQALSGTIALNWEALRQGALILRVHDTREAVQCVQLYEMYEKNML